MKTKPQTYVKMVCISLITLCNCTEDTFVQSKHGKEAPTDLSYAETGEAREGKAIKSSLPTVKTYGGMSRFSIVEVKSETDKSDQLLSQFEIDDSTGIITSPAGNTLIGKNTYMLDIQVKANGDSTLFTDGYTVNILTALIEGLNYPVSKETFVRGQDTTSRKPYFLGNTDDLVFSLPETPGNEHFTIHPDSGWIVLSKEATPEVGEHSISVAANNAADSLMTFNDVLTITILSKPYRLTYTPATEEVQQGAPRTTQAPVVSAAPLEVTFALAENTPEHFSINENTGAVSLALGHPYKEGEQQAVSVKASNVYGEEVFKDVLVFSFTAPSTEPPSNLTYSDNGTQVIMETRAFESSVPSIEGGYPIVFSITSGNVDNAFSIDPLSGVISLPKGHALSVGDYTIEVQAKNDYDAVTITYTLSITPLEKSVFFDGDFTASGAVKDGATGNMKAFDLDNNAEFSGLKKAWYGKTTIWSQIDGKKRGGVQFFPQKATNNDWLVAEQVDLSKSTASELFLEWYQLYGSGMDAISRYTLQVSEDYVGSIENATWQELVFLNPLFEPEDGILGSASQVTPAYVEHEIIDLSAYDGKVVTIAIQALHDHTLQDGKEEKNLTKATCIAEFVVRGIEEE